MWSIEWVSRFGYEALGIIKFDTETRGNILLHSLDEKDIWNLAIVEMNRLQKELKERD